MGRILLRNQAYEVENEKPVSIHIPEYNILIKNTVLGKDVSIWANLNIYGAVIGENTKLGSFIEIRSDVQIGKNCKLEPFIFIPEGVSLEDNVFIGPNVTFTNDLYPRACNPDGSLITNYEISQTLVRSFASIGAGCVIRCGIKIGRNSMIGAGSVLTKDIGDHELWYATPASCKGKVRK
ncbi:MAG: N-acetyltransferase [Candidatus Riflebacteria bacterium]|nr:N-acetyltransferase [Candidatus Riflebacteria bacterium]